MCLVLTLATALGVFHSTTQAAVVQTTNKKMSAGQADFGSGHHSFGSPEGNATITFDWQTGSGQLVSTGRVRGTLYWDSLFDSGCARLIIRFLNAAGTSLRTRQIDQCGPGGDANNSSNQRSVDELFSGADLFDISLRLSEIRGGSEITASSLTIPQVATKSFPVTIDNGTADFGDGGHHFGRPDDPGFISFDRNTDGTVTGSVDGILFWDSLSTKGCASMTINFRSALGGNDILTRTACGPGGDANNGANEFFIGDTFTSGLLSTIRITVFSLSSTAPAAVLEFGFAGRVGDFEVEPAAATVHVNEPVDIALTWTVPDPLNWHDLDTLELRIMDGSDPIFHVRFKEDGNLVSVLHSASGKFGQDFPAGSHARLETPHASLSLADTIVAPVNGALGSGPNSPTVRLVLPLRFKPSAAGKTYLIEVAASDDLGHRDPFALAGTLTVR